MYSINNIFPHSIGFLILSFDGRKDLANWIYMHMQIIQIPY